LQPTWPAALPPSKLCHHGVAGHAAEPWSVSRPSDRRKLALDEFDALNFAAVVTSLHTNLKDINVWGSICSIGAVAPTAWGFLHQLVTPTSMSALAAGPGRLPTILVLGGLAAAAHGILWSVAEWAFGWHFEAGGYRSLPSGWSAIVLSLTQTVPLVAVPLGYQAFSGVPIIPQRHLLAGISAIGAAIVGNLVMYGSGRRTFLGLRRRFAPRLELTRGRAIVLEAIWATMHFACTSVLYRTVVVAPRWSVPSLLTAPVLGAALFFFGMVTFILLRPGAVRERRWIQARGVIAGVILSVALEGSMLA
jgi:hypothetical protein